MKRFVAVIFYFVSFAGVFASDLSNYSYKPINGYVPDAKTAIKIAVAVWEPIYGEAKIRSEKPYATRLDKNGVWVVEGTLCKHTCGGVALAEISKSDGKVLRVSHGK